MRFTIYYSKADRFIEPLNEYAKSIDRTVGYTIRKILNEYFSVNEAFNEGFKESMLANKELMKRHMADVKPKKQKKIKKVDPTTFEAEVMSKIIGNDTNAENCSRRTIDGEGNPSCYHFDNFREYYPFCVKDCWGNKNIWKDKARKLKPIEKGEVK